jgi:hypothetical protein
MTCSPFTIAVMRRHIDRVYTASTASRTVATASSRLVCPQMWPSAAPPCAKALTSYSQPNRRICTALPFQHGRRLRWCSRGSDQHPVTETPARAAGSRYLPPPRPIPWWIMGPVGPFRCLPDDAPQLRVQGSGPDVVADRHSRRVPSRLPTGVVGGKVRKSQ